MSVSVPKQNIHQPTQDDLDPPVKGLDKDQECQIWQVLHEEYEAFSRDDGDNGNAANLELHIL